MTLFSGQQRCAHDRCSSMTRSYSDRQRALKWVLLVMVRRTILDATASVLTRLGNSAAQLVLRTQPRRAALRTASVRQDQGKYSELFCNGFLRYSGSLLCFLLTRSCCFSPF